MKFKSLNFIKKSAAIDIYTDGSVKNNTATWAYIVTFNGKIIKKDYGKLNIVDCNYAEFTAVIKAIETITKPSRINIHTDSRVVVDTMSLWASDWNQQGWLKKNKRPIPFVETIKQLYFLSLNHKIQWQWVKSHSGDRFNEDCDHLCNIAHSI